MIQIVNANPKDFMNDVKKNKLFLFGAGKRARYLSDIYNLEKNIEAIVDNNENKTGAEFQLKNNKIPIICIDDFIAEVKKTGIDKIILLITPAYYALSIIEQLDKISELDNLRCYVGRLLDDNYEKQEIEFTEGKNIIPKRIHYCWFGGKEIPAHLQKYIDSWKKVCPDYEIIRWDESNYDISKNRYMNEAYKSKKWGFVPDYARLDIIYNEGGIYLDTDVELIASPDRVLKDNMFCGFNCYGLINLGVGFGAVQGNEFIRELKDAYDGISFYNSDMSENLTACSWYQHPIFQKHGFKLDNTFQRKNGIALYPSEVLSPLGGSGCANNFTDNTISIHHAELSWVTANEKDEYERFRENILDRLKA